MVDYGAGKMPRPPQCKMSIVSFYKHIAHPLIKWTWYFSVSFLVKVDKKQFISKRHWGGYCFQPACYQAAKAICQYKPPWQTTFLKSYKKVSQLKLCNLTMRLWRCKSYPNLTRDRTMPSNRRRHRRSPWRQDSTRLLLPWQWQCPAE